ncbi:MAG: hypothetical protein JSS87_12565 [Acidobacteria bacterium]|nr:hypothetical protein [Acidobacteriota bacterium]
MILQVVPKVFYEKLEDALDLWERALGFKVVHRDPQMAVVEREGAKLYLLEAPEYAKLDRPEIALIVDTIDDLHRELTINAPNLLHPNLKMVEERPWGAREFAVLDRTGVCIVFRQWPQK